MSEVVSGASGLRKKKVWVTTLMSRNSTHEKYETTALTAISVVVTNQSDLRHPKAAG